MDTKPTKPEEHEKEDENNVCTIFCTSLFQLALQGILGYLAFVVSTRPKYYGDPIECHDLRIWTYNYAILVFYVMGWDIICLSLTLIGTAFSILKFVKILRTFNSMVYPFIFMLYIGSLIMMTIYFFFWENCGKCRTFVFIMIVGFWTTVCFFFLYIGCSSAFCYHALRGLYDRRFGSRQENTISDNQEERIIA